MKFDEIESQQDKLLVYMYALNEIYGPNGLFTYNKYTDTVIKLGITKNLQSLRSMLSTLVLKGYVRRINLGVYQITKDGRIHISAVADAVDDYSAESLVHGIQLVADEPEDENDEQDPEDEVAEDLYKAVSDAIKAAAAAIELVAKTIGH